MDRIKKILEENKSLKILGPLLFVAIIVVVIMYLPKSPTDTGTIPIPDQTNPPTVTSQPTTLPGETDTDFSPSTKTEEEPADASLIGPPEYKGALRGQNGITVLIQFTNVSKKLKIGESIAGYKLKAIADDDSSITIEKDNLITVLQISPNSN